MDDETPKPKLELVPPTEEELDEEEQEFRALRRDLPGVKGASAAGIVAISVGKAPAKNEFFRCHPEFRPIIPMVNCEMGMERQYFAVTPDMVEPLAGIGISVTDHALYLTITSRGAVRIVPVRQANSDGEQNEYDAHQGNRHAAGARAVGAAVHRYGKPLLPGFSRTSGSVRRRRSGQC